MTNVINMCPLFKKDVFDWYLISYDIKIKIKKLLLSMKVDVHSILYGT